MVTGSTFDGYILAASMQAPKGDITRTLVGDAFTVAASATLISGHRLEMSGTVRPKRCTIGPKKLPGAR